MHTCMCVYVCLINFIGGMLFLWRFGGFCFCVAVRNNAWPSLLVCLIAIQSNAPSRLILWYTLCTLCSYYVNFNVHCVALLFSLYFHFVSAFLAYNLSLFVSPSLNFLESNGYYKPPLMCCCMCILYRFMCTKGWD